MSKNTTISVRDLIARNNLYISNKKADEIRKQETGELRWVDPASLMLDHEYQRDLNTKHAMEIAEGFDYKNMKPATGFVDADGQILVTDGQHTVTAAAIVGLAKVPVYIHFLPEGISAERALAMQSKQFLSINLSQRAMSRYDIYNNKLIQARADRAAARIDSTHPEPLKSFLDLEAMCNRVGANPCPSVRPFKHQPGAISHIANLETGWFNIGEKASEEALVFLRKYFPKDPVDGGLHIGVIRFIKNMAAAASRGRVDAAWDPAVLYKAITQDGKLDMAGAYDELKEISSSLGLPGNTPVQNWVAAAIRQAYNEYVLENKLASGRLGRY